MLNLYWKSGDQTRSLIKKPFPSEAAFEKYIFDHQDILGDDIYVLHRQVRTGDKQGILDMMGIDQDGNVCIIELKNEEADERAHGAPPEPQRPHGPTLQSLRLGEAAAPA